MPNINYELSFLLPVATTIVLGLAAICIIRFERLCQRLLSFWNSPTGSALQESSNGTEALEIQLRALQANMDTVLQAIENLQQVRTTPLPQSNRGMPLENAVRMAKHGATTDDLTKTCGLNIGEAHLLRRLHSELRQPEKLAS